MRSTLAVQNASTQYARGPLSAAQAHRQFQARLPSLGRARRWQYARASRAAPAAPAAPARGSTRREDKDSLTVGPRKAVRRLGSRREDKDSLTVGPPAALRRLARRGEDKDSPEFPIFPHSTTPAAAAPAGAAGPARSSARREDKDSLTVGSHTAVRRLGCRGEDKDSPEFLIFPHSTTPPRRVRRARRLRRARRALAAGGPPGVTAAARSAGAARAARHVRLLAAVDPEAERATGRKGLVMRGR